MVHRPHKSSFVTPNTMGYAIELQNFLEKVNRYQFPLLSKETDNIVKFLLTF